MICPHCKKEFNLPYNVARNIDQYDQSSLMSTPCCGKGVHVRQARTFVCSAYNGTKTEDDWGTEIKPSTP